MSADLLRRAAAKIRETASGPRQAQALGWAWGPEIDGALGGYSGAHAALWAPDVALLVATWLDDIARHWEIVAEQAEDPDDPVDEDGQRIDDTLDHHAVTLAHRILGDES